MPPPRESDPQQGPLSGSSRPERQDQHNARPLLREGVWPFVADHSLDHRCPACGAPPGEPCRAYRVRVHAPRLDKGNTTYRDYELARANALIDAENARAAAGLDEPTIDGLVDITSDDAIGRLHNIEEAAWWNAVRAPAGSQSARTWVAHAAAVREVIEQLEFVFADRQTV